MNRLRDCAVVLGLAGMILMASADTKDAEAKENISYKCEMLPAGRMAAEKTQACRMQIEEKQIQAEQIEPEQSEAEQIEPEQSEAEQIETEQVKDAEEPAVIYELSEEDYDALLRIVEAEASGEDIRGRMLVANVVLNRVESGCFPDTVREVVYQREGGRAQFSPVATGKIDRVTVSGATKEAVDLALQGEDESEGALYFMAPEYADAGNRRWFEENLTLLFAYHGHEFYA